MGDLLIHCCFESGKVFQQLDSIKCDALGKVSSKKMMSFSQALFHELMYVLVDASLQTLSPLTRHLCVVRNRTTSSNELP